MSNTAKKIAFNFIFFTFFYFLTGIFLLIGDYYYLYSYQPNVIYIHPFFEQAYWLNIFTLYKVLGILLLILTLSQVFRVTNVEF